DPASLAEGLAEYHPADIADAFEDFPPEDTLRAFENVPAAFVGQVLTYANVGILKLALTRLPPPVLGKALDAVETDDAVRILSFRPEEKRVPVLNEMSAGDRAAARGLLAYEAGTAGRLMTGKFVRITPSMTVAETFDHLRKVDPEVATVSDLYAVDPADGRLV